MYARIEATAPKFDGRVAWTHLTRNLAMVLCRADAQPEVGEKFGRWLDRHRGQITVHPQGPTFLLPPRWFK